MSNADYLSAKMESLILEIDSMCRRHKMEYYLMEEALVAAIRGKGFPNKRKALSIAMHGKDIKTLRRLVKRKSGRTLESLLNNEKFPGFYLRYVDDNTLLYDTSRSNQPYENCCIGINIYVLCPYRERTDFIGRFTEYMKESWARNIIGCQSGIKYWLCVAFSKVVKFDKRFSKMMKKNADRTNLVEFYTARGQHFVFEIGKFGMARRLKVGEHSFKVPRAMKIVGRATNDGNLYFDAKNDIHILHNRYLINYNISGNVFRDIVEKNKLNSNRDIKKTKKYIDWKENYFSKIWDKRKVYYEYYFLTKFRFSYYQELCGDQKKYILSLYKEKNYEELYKILKGYITRINVHNKRGFGLYFDKDIFIIALNTMAYLELKRERVKVIAKKKVNRLKRMVDKIPQPYLKPLDQDVVYTNEELESIREVIREELDGSLHCLVEDYYSE